MKKRTKVILLVIILAGIILGGTLMNKTPKQQKINLDSEQISNIADGVYQGECENGLVLVSVNTKMENGRISKIDLLEHRNGLGRGAEVITKKVIDQQSLKIEVISGATYSSETILKAIENSLTVKE